MPDFSPESQEARLTAALVRARQAGVIERCGPGAASLEWTSIGTDGTATAGDGRYLVRPVARGFVATVHQDSKEILPSDTYASRREACAWCQGVEDWRRMVAAELEGTREHEPLSVEVTVEDPR